MEQRFTVVDLFCGAGGMSLGFQQAGFEILVGIDSEQIHVDTYQSNFPQTRTIRADVAELSGTKVRELAEIGTNNIDVVVGGPPCQGFSEIGRRRSNDPRNDLVDHFGRLVIELEADYFVLENVEGLVKNNRAKLASFLWYMRVHGYMVVCPIRVLDAADYGVPQRRRRLILLGYKHGLPKPSYPAASADPPPTVWDAIRDLKDVVVSDQSYDKWQGSLGKASAYSANLRTSHDGQQATLSGCARTRHSETIIARFRKTTPGSKEAVSKYARLKRNGLAGVLRAGTGPEQGSFTAPRPIHPTQSRCITVREAARIQSFPDSFLFHHTIWHGFRQVGNSVPPKLAKACACSIKDAINLLGPIERTVRVEGGLDYGP